MPDVTSPEFRAFVQSTLEGDIDRALFFGAVRWPHASDRERDMIVEEMSLLLCDYLSEGPDGRR